MIAVPFIYFSFLLIYIIRKNKAFDVSAGLVSIYAFTSFFAILIDKLDLYNNLVPNIEIHFIPTFIFCIILSLTIYPFYKFRSSKIENIVIVNNEKLFDYIVYLFFGVFILFIVFYLNDIIFRLVFGDLGQLRNEINRGNFDGSQITFTGIKRVIATAMNFFAEGSLIMLLFFFYSLSFLKKSKLFNLIILFGSFSVILLGIMGLDRSKTIYWILTFYLMVVFFSQYLGKAQKRTIIKIVIIFGSLIILYLAAMTISRFGDEDNGELTSIIIYAGQPFINYCNFFDNLKTEISFHRLFPGFYKLFKDSDDLGLLEWSSYIKMKTGISINVFSTFIGDLMAYIGKIGFIMYGLVYYKISSLVLRRKNLSILTFDQLILFFILVLVPLLGMFAYYYSYHTRTISAVFFVLLSVLFKYKIKY